MLLDTGSDAGLLDPDAAAAAGARRDPVRAVIDGAGAAPSLPVATLRTLALGELRLADVAFPLGRLPAAPMLHPPVAGLIGGDLLSDFEVELDLAAREMRLYPAPPGGAPCRLPPWRPPFDTLPARRQGDRLLVAATLDGRPIEAVLDTGARSRIVSTRLAAALGVTADTLAAEPGGYTRGIGTPERLYHWHRFRSLSIGAARDRDPVLTVAPIAGGAEMLLGSDWFATRRVWLSYATGRVFVAPAGA